MTPGDEQAWIVTIILVLVVIGLTLTEKLL